MRKLLVIIVTFNGMKWLERCLDSVVSSTAQADIFVCDNCSEDGSADFVQRRYPQAVLVRSESNLGFARANDMGFKYALENGYDFVYLLNQDAWVLPDTFTRLMDAFVEGKWGLISPMQMKPDLKTPDRRFNRHYHGTMDPVDTVQPVRFVMAAHWMLPVWCLRSVGLFSPAFTHYGEDNNYCERVKYHGYGVGVLPSAMAVHDRQDRKMDKSSRARQNCQYSRVCLSNPDSSFLLQAVWQPLRQCFMSLRWLSLFPVRDIPALIKSYPELRRWRAESLSEGAFIIEESKQ